MLCLNANSSPRYRAELLRTARDGETVVFHDGDHTLDEELNLPAKSMWVFEDSAKLVCSKPVVLSCFIQDTQRHIFESTSTIDLTQIGNDFVRPEWFGAEANRPTDCTPGIQAAIDSLAIRIQGLKLVQLAGGYYAIASTVWVSGAVALRGVSRASTDLTWNPKGKDFGTAMITVGADPRYPDRVPYKCDLSDARLTGNHQLGIGLHLHEASRSLIERLDFFQWTGANEETWDGVNDGAKIDFGIGLRIQGHEVCVLRDLLFADCDQPIWISRRDISTVDLDHFHWQNIHVRSRTEKHAVHIDDNTVIQLWTWDGGCNNISGCAGVLDYHNTRPTPISQSWRWEGVHHEQGTVGSAYAVDVRFDEAVAYNLSFNSVTLAPNTNGFRFANCFFVSLQNCRVDTPSGGVSLAVDSCREISIVNCYWSADSIASYSGVEVIWSPRGDRGAISPPPATAAIG